MTKRVGFLSTRLKLTIEPIETPANRVRLVNAPDFNANCVPLEENLDVDGLFARDCGYTATVRPVSDTIGSITSRTIVSFGFVYSMLAQLIPINGGAPITLTKPITVIGRSSRLCDLAVDHGAVSKLHCILVKTDGLIYMRDLGSTNGTRVNGQRVLRGALLPGDQISFSGAVYKVHLGPDPQLSAGGDLLAGPTDFPEKLPEVVIGDDDDVSAIQPRRKSLADSDLLAAD